MREHSISRRTTAAPFRRAIPLQFLPNPRIANQRATIRDILAGLSPQATPAAKASDDTHELSAHRREGNGWVPAPGIGQVPAAPCLQARLEIGAVEDPLEHEADRIADQVMRMPDLERAIASASPQLSRKCTECEEEEKLQKKEAGTEAAAGYAPASVHEVLRSPGQPLDAETRAFFESRFGQDFSKVRVHTDSAAAESAQAIQARAFTSGQDIVFGARQYSPGDADSRMLIAHELTHALQQSHGTVARQPSTQTRLTELERSVRILKKKQAATDVDRYWSAQFGEVLASRKRAVLRVTGSLDAAVQGFQSAQREQAQTDALATQLIGGGAAVMFAFGFEWIAFGALGQLGMKATKLEKAIELIENPANVLVSSGVNVAGVLTAGSSAKKGSTPTGGVGGGSAMSYLTRNLEALEHHSQLINQAFLNRSASLEKMTDEQWEQFDADRVKTSYQQLLSELNNSGEGVEAMKEQDTLALVLEKHLWALWLQSNIEALRRKHEAEREVAAASGSGPLPEFRPYKPEEDLNVGTDIEARLNLVGVAKDAVVTLTGHWYSSNSPANWKEKLSNWAYEYKESISNKPAPGGKR